MDPTEPNPHPPATDAPRLGEASSDVGADPSADPSEAPDPLAFQRAALLLLVFRFRGKRSLVASRTLSGRDFVAELRAHAPVLERHYPRRRVSAVEIVSYQHGRFYVDPWPGGLRLLERFAPNVVTDPTPDHRELEEPELDDREREEPIRPD